MTGPTLRAPVTRDAGVSGFSGQQPQVDFIIRKTRGTTENDLKRFFLKCVMLGKFTPDELREAYLRDLKKQVQTAYNLLKRHGLVEEHPDGRITASTIIGENYAAASDAVYDYLKPNAGQWLNFDQILLRVSSNCDVIGRQVPDWRRLLVSFVLAELVSSDICRQKFDNGRNMFQMKPDDGTPKTFVLAFRIRETRGTTEEDVAAFFLKLLACARDGLSYEGIERAFTFNLEQAYENIRLELIIAGVLTERDGYFRYTDTFDRIYLTIKDSIVRRVEANPAKICVDYLEPLVRAEFYQVYDDPGIRNAVPPEQFKDLFLAALTALDNAGRVRIINQKFEGSYRSYVARGTSTEGGVLPLLFLREGPEE